MSRWFQFRLKSLFVFMLVLAVALSWWSDHLRMEERLAAERENTTRERAEADAVRAATALMSPAFPFGGGSDLLGGWVLSQPTVEVDVAMVEHLKEFVAGDPTATLIQPSWPQYSTGSTEIPTINWPSGYGGPINNSFTGLVRSSALFLPSGRIGDIITMVQDVAPKDSGSVAALVKLLVGEDAKRQAQAACTLARLGPNAKAAVPNLIAALHDRDAAVQYHAAYALGRSGANSPEVLAALRQAMESDPPTNAAFAAQMLFRLDSASDVEPRIVELISSSNGGVRRQAIRAAMAVQRAKSQTPTPFASTAAAVAAFQPLCRDPDKETAKLAIQAMAQIAPQAEAHAALRDMVRDRAHLDAELWQFAAEVWYPLDRAVSK